MSFITTLNVADERQTFPTVSLSKIVDQPIKEYRLIFTGERGDEIAIRLTYTQFINLRNNIIPLRIDLL